MGRERRAGGLGLQVCPVFVDQAPAGGSLQEAVAPMLAVVTKTSGSSQTMRLLRSLVLVGTVAVVAGPVQAGSVQQANALKRVSITSLQEGAFTATGRSLCQAGQASTPFAAVSRTYPDGSLDLVVVKRFTCDDGSGRFEMTLHVRLRLLSPGTFENTFRWMISAGTGRYEDLEGFGTGAGVARDSGELVDFYTGRIGSGRKPSMALG